MKLLDQTLWTYSHEIDKLVSNCTLSCLSFSSHKSGRGYPFWPDLASLSSVHLSTSASVLKRTQAWPIFQPRNPAHSLDSLSLSCSRAKFLENVVYFHCLRFLPLHPLPTTHFLLDSDPFFYINLSRLPVSLSLNPIGLLKSFIVLNTQHC